MRAVVDARPTEALKAPGAWGLGWPNCRNCRFAGTAVTLAGLAQSSAAQQVFHADQKFMLAAAAPARSVPPVCVPLVLVALNGDTHPLTDWHVNDPVTIDLEFVISDMDWIALARRQHPELGGRTISDRAGRRGRRRHRVWQICHRAGPAQRRRHAARAGRAAAGRVGVGPTNTDP